MKKTLKIFLIIVLMIGILFGLTACGDSDSNSGTSADEKTIDKYEEAMNSQDIDELYDLIVYDEDVYDEIGLSRISKSDMKEILENISSYKIKNYTKIKTRSDLEEFHDDVTEDDWDTIEDIIDDGNKVYYLDILIDDEEDEDIIIINRKNKISFARNNIYF